MNANEIVRALRRIRELRIFGNNQTQLMGEAADLIESLQAQLTEKDLEIEVLEGRAENQREYLLSLRQQLLESQRREKAARNELCLKCGRYHDANNGACDGCRWKGAEHEEAENTRASSKMR